MCDQIRQSVCQSICKSESTTKTNTTYKLPKVEKANISACRTSAGRRRESVDRGAAIKI